MTAAFATPTTTWYLLLGAVLFSIGVVGVMVRRNPLVLFMCVELMLNAVNLTFVAFSTRLGDVGVVDTSLTLVVTGRRAFRIDGRQGAMRLSLSSTMAADSFLGASLETLRR